MRPTRPWASSPTRSGCAKRLRSLVLAHLDRGLPVHAHLDRRRPPTNLTDDPTRTAGALLPGDGRLAHRARLRRPGIGHHARAPRPAPSAHARARATFRPAARLPRRSALAQGAPTRRALREARPARRRLEVGDGAVRYRLTRGADDAADARRLRRVRTRHDCRPRHRRTGASRPRGQMDERPHALRLHTPERTAPPRPGQGTDRPPHLPPLRRPQARHHPDRVRSKPKAHPHRANTAGHPTRCN
jgi:hypothetical protein